MRNRKSGTKPKLQDRRRLSGVVMLILSGLHMKNGELKVSSGESEFPKDKMTGAIIQAIKESPELFENAFVNFAAYKDPYYKSLEDVLQALASMYYIRYERQKTLTVVEEKEKKVFMSILLAYHGKHNLKKSLPVVCRFNKIMNANKS